MNHYAYIELLESTGKGPAKELAVTSPKLLGNDAHSYSSIAKPVRLNADRSPVYTCERWVRMRFSPPFGRVGQFRLWSPTMTLPEGWDVRFGTSLSYRTPSQSPSVYAYTSIPTVDPGVGTPNVVGLTTRNSDGVQYSPWIVFQAILTGPDVDVSEQTLSFDFGWVES